LATLVTPNLHEAECLSGLGVRTLEQMKESAKRILDLGPTAVLIKGGHLEAGPIDVLYDGTEFNEFHANRVDTPNTHGTGCTYSAAIATFLAHDHSLSQAVERAKRFVTAGIVNASAIGSGHGPLNHYAAAEALKALQLLPAHGVAE